MKVLHAIVDVYDTLKWAVSPSTLKAGRQSGLLVIPLAMFVPVPVGLAVIRIAELLSGNTI